MPLYNLMREYEERRQALVDQLKNNPNMDPAVQHQIYGAVKEIENFLKSVEFQIATSQQQSLSIELSRDRPRPFVERTKKVVNRVKSGTRKVVREHIPRVTKKVTAGPKKYFAARRKKKELKKQIEREILARLQHDVAVAGTLPSEVRTDVQQLPEMPDTGKNADEMILEDMVTGPKEPKAPKPKKVKKKAKKPVKKAKTAKKKPVKKAKKVRKKRK